MAAPKEENGLYAVEMKAEPTEGVVTAFQDRGLCTLQGCLQTVGQGVKLLS